MYSLHSLPTIFHAPLHTSTVRRGYAFPVPHTWGAPPHLRQPSHSLPLPHQNQRQGHEPCLRFQRPGVRGLRQGFPPTGVRLLVDWGGGGDGVEWDIKRYSTEVKERRRSWSPRAGGREERRCVENEGPIPDARLWLPRPPASRNPTAGTEGGREDPPLSPFSALATKANELPALPSTSHDCGWRPMSFEFNRRSRTKVPPLSPSSRFSLRWLY